MKRGTPDHPKMREFGKSLNIPWPHAVGLIENLIHWTARYAVQGNIGKWEDERIASGIGWSGNAKRLISALVNSGWVDEDEACRLIIHDWDEHSDQSVRKTLKSRGLGFLKPCKHHQVYFILASKSQLVRIGTTGRRVEDRMSELRALSPEELVLLGSIQGGTDVEDRIHNQLASYRSKGEWFRAVPEVMSFVTDALILSGTDPESFRNVPSCQSQSHKPVPIVVAPSRSGADPDDVIREVVERMFERHRTGRKSSIDGVAQAILTKLNGSVNKSELAKALNVRHISWCNSEDWTKESGKYTPWLERWITSEKSDAEPPKEKTGAIYRSVSEMPDPRSV